MARLLVLTDRLPGDLDWKGAFTWDLIRSLAESQHQVLALTTEDPGEFNVSHPRLTIARPGKSWGVQYLPKFLQAILLFQPDVVCTITPKNSLQLKGLTIWPYLQSALMVLPKIQRFSALFETKDTEKNQSSLSWHKGTNACVVFTSSHRRDLRVLHEGNIMISPFEMSLPQLESEYSETRYLLIPASVSEWTNPAENLQRLHDHLVKNPRLQVRINGGWGDMTAGEKRTAWQTLMPVADRLQLLEPLSFTEMIKQAKGAEGFWLEAIPADSWRDVVSRFVAQQLGKQLPENRPALAAGSTANFLSRLFAGTFEPWPTP